MPARLVGLYALTCMERDGGVYGYSLANRISERTGGAWRPGPGAVYPALKRLAERGFANVHGSGRRQVYRITARGRRVLRQVRLHRSAAGGSGPDLSLLWAEIVGAPDDATFLLHRLRRSLDGIETHLSREPGVRAGSHALRADALAELRAATERLGRGRSRTVVAQRRRGAKA
jgi:DNA-binding PadR family transcriptional regulator